MTRKDYMKIAAVLAKPTGLPLLDEEYHANIVRIMANMFANDNPRFDRARFYAACGMEQGT